MTRESKVGLFVGLSIIILFAVVIADKGQTRRTAPANFGTAMADGSRSTRSISGADRATGRPDEGRLQVDRVLPNPDNVVTLTPPPAHSEPTPPQPAPTEIKRAPLGLPEAPASVLADGSDTEKPTTVKREEVAMTDGDGSPTRSSTSDKDTKLIIPRSADAIRASDSTPDDTEVASNEPRKKSTSGDDAEKLDRLKKLMNGEPADERSSEPTDKNDRTDDSSSQPPVEVATRTHTIKPGESLWKIAQQYFGSSDRQVVDAIYDANRHTLHDRNSIRVGQELVIPVSAAGNEMSGIGVAPTNLTARSNTNSRGTAQLPKIPPSLDDGSENKPEAVAKSDKKKVTKPATSTAKKSDAKHSPRNAALAKGKKSLSKSSKPAEVAAKSRHKGAVTVADRSEKSARKRPAASRSTKSKRASDKADSDRSRSARHGKDRKAGEVLASQGAHRP